MSKDVQTSKEVARVDQQPTQQVATNFIKEVDVMNPQAIATALSNMKPAPIRTDLIIWEIPLDASGNPVPGSALEGLFRGITSMKMPSRLNPGTFDNVEVATFFKAEKLVDTKTGEILPDQQLVYIGVAAKRVVSHFREVPVNTAWRIVCTGKQKNKSNQNSSYTFAIYQMLSL